MKKIKLNAGKLQLNKEKITSLTKTEASLLGGLGALQMGNNTVDAQMVNYVILIGTVLSKIVRATVHKTHLN
jgi:3-hydroxy-3-methylglutaryl CoA synthase